MGKTPLFWEVPHSNTWPRGTCRIFANLALYATSWTIVGAITMQEMAVASVGVGDQRAAKHEKSENYRDFHVLGKIISPDFRKYQNFENLRY